MIYPITAFKRFFSILLFVSLLYVKNLQAQEESEYFFPQQEYEHYMRLIAEIDPYVHNQLNRCHKELGSPCIEKDEANPRIEPATEDTLGHPVIFLASMLDKPEHEQREILAFYVNKHRFLDRHLSQQERNYILTLIKSIDPTLYEVMVEDDPSGIRHIFWKDGELASTFSEIDGLPVIFVDRYILGLLDPAEQQSCIAHELGHYVLKHLQGPQTPSHDYFFERSADDDIPFAKGKKVSNQLPAYQTFKFAAERIQEHEADRSAVMDFGVDIDIMLSAARKIRDGTEAFEHTRKTFKRTHPLWDDRIKHIESLRPEVDLKIAKQQQPVRFNWKQLAKEYMESFSF